MGSMEGSGRRYSTRPTPPRRRAVRIRENGVRFEVDFAEGTRPGSSATSARTGPPSAVLDGPGSRPLLYTGGFSLFGQVLGGAADVTSVDLDEAAAAQAQAQREPQSGALQLRACRRLRVRAADVSATASPGTGVVLDPAQIHLHARRTWKREGRQKYEDLNQLSIGLVKPGGIFVTCSCSGLLSPGGF